MRVIGCNSEDFFYSSGVGFLGDVNDEIDRLANERLDGLGVIPRHGNQAGEPG
jgi:hypothetical protein